MNKRTLLVVGDTAPKAFAGAVRCEQLMRERFGLKPGHVPQPYKNRLGRWVVWLDILVPVGVISLGIGQSLSL